MRRLLLVPLLFLLTGGPAFASCSNTNYRVMAKIKAPPGTSGTKFLLIEPGASDVDIRNVASGSCGNRWCRLLMWDDVNEMGLRFPLSKREDKTQIAYYLHNPGTNLEILSIRGKEFPMGKCTNLR